MESPAGQSFGAYIGDPTRAVEVEDMGSFSMVSFSDIFANRCVLEPELELALGPAGTAVVPLYLL